MAKILVVDDQVDNLELVEQILGFAGHKIITAVCGEDAILRAVQDEPDVIILDVDMPEMDGYEVCRILKDKEETESIPILFLTAYHTSELNVVKGLTLGAYDFVPKSFKDFELLARVGVMVRIRENEKRIEKMSLTDSLTGLYNRRYLYSKFRDEIARAQRKQLSLSCLLLDIDHFKNINDIHGHKCGDYVLEEVARLLEAQLRMYDTITRYGGEEFMVILPMTSEEEALGVAEKIRQAIENNQFKQHDETIQVTTSIGVFSCDKRYLLDDVDEYIRNADQAMYTAKNGGRNQVKVYNK
ncbi:MAG: diguanylate cyclase [Gammaproteobacteria bacterium]|nr:diguanylate cyclase [Gammaproteobacteria bacterium]